VKVYSDLLGVLLPRRCAGCGGASDLGFCAGCRREFGRALGELLVDAISASSAAADAIVAVPLHRSRLIERGYNQALELARPLAAATRKPLLVSGIHRRRPTAPQSQLAAAHRRQNLRGAFRVSRRIEGMHLAIVDDVMTTGATVEALAEALRSAGAASVVAWVLARSAAEKRGGAGHGSRM
jgi:ComF family protein